MQRWIIAGVLSLIAPTLSAQTSSPLDAPKLAQTTMKGIQYSISIPNPNNHYAEVTLVIDNPKAGNLEVYMPVWTPGSYLVREFSKNVEGFYFSFSDGDVDKKAILQKNQSGLIPSSVKSAKKTKNSWVITVAKNTKKVTVGYRIYCFELSVRTSYIESQQALLNMASVLMTAKGYENLPGTTSVTFPTQWQNFACTLDELPAGGVPQIGDYRTIKLSYPNFDELVDAPLQLGYFEMLKFEVRGIPHYVVMVGPNNANAEKLTADMAKICETMTQVINEHPCKKYIFFVHNVDNGGGGLEHKNSSVLMMQRLGYTDPGKYKGFLGLVAHEYFHLWNVKRLRPKELGPFNYSQENYTTLLWVAEGITSYYDEIAMYRAGFSTADEFLGSMAAYINSHENRPGSKVGSVSEMSFDAWIKEYRPNENSRNSTYSYYSKGVVIGFLLDAWICANTNGTKSLDNVMQYLWKNYTLNTSKNPNGEGFTEWDFQKAIETVVGTVCDPLFSELIHGYNDLQPQIEESIGKNGLNLQVTKNILKKETLGVSADISAGKTIVKSVNRESLGERLGLQPNDEIIAVNGFRVENNADELLVKTSVVNSENSGDAWGIRVPWIDLTTKDADPKEKSVNLLISRHGLLLQLNGAVFPTEEVQYKIKLPIQATQSKESDAEFWKSKGGIQHLLR
jgi:predicted metalloprotease with PDZ domain